MRITAIFILSLITCQFALGQRISGLVSEIESGATKRSLSSLPAGLIFFEGFDNINTPDLPNGWTTLSSGPSGFSTATSGNSIGQANENGFWPVPLHGLFALTNDDVCNCNKSLDVLLSKIFNLSSLNYARIGFSAFQNGSNGQTASLQIRESNGNWFDLIDIIASAEWEDYRISIPKNYLKSNFQFRFRYHDNNGYASGLAIDDIFISSTPTENFELNKLFSISPEVEASGFFPDQLPRALSVAYHMRFSANIESDSRDVKNARLAVDIKGPLSFNDTSSSWLLERESNSIIGLPKRSSFTPYDSGLYRINASLITDSADLNLSNNQVEESFLVTDTVFQWNSEQSDGTGIWILESLDRLGSIVQVTTLDTLRSAWVGIHPSTEVGSRFKVKIFSFETLTASIFTSSPYQVGEEDLKKKVRIEMTTALEPGKYLIAIEKESGRIVINTTAAVKSPFGVSFYKSVSQDWRHIGYYPDLSLAFDPISSDCPAHIQADITDESCPLANDGSIFIQAVGATQFHSKVWSNGAGDVDSIGNLDSDFYQVFITDGSCTYDRIFEIEASTPLEINAQLSFDTCSNSVGSISLSSQAGHQPHIFFINGSATNSFISGLSQGSYLISMENDLGCSSDTLVAIEGTNQLNVSINAQPSGCGSSNGKITSSPSGTSPFHYNWNNGDSTSALNGIPSGIYNLSVQDSIGCLQVVTVLLGDSNAPNLSLIDLTNNACADDATGSIALTSTGGSGNITYLWSNSDALSEISNLNSGTYNVTIQDTLGCSNYGSYSISDISKPFDIDFLERGISCFGNSDGQIEVLISGGFKPYTYNWNPAQYDTNQLFNLSVGDYSVTVIDNQNCTSSAATTIITQPKFFLEIDSLFADSSNNGQNDAGIFMSVYGGTPLYRYNWNNGLITQDISQVDTGFYSVIVSDQFGCELSYEKYLSNDPLRVEPTSNSPQIQVFPNPVLAKNSITIRFGGLGGTYTLRNIRGRVIESGILYSPNTHLILKNPGMYLLSVDDSSGNTSIHKLIAH